MLAPSLNTIINYIWRVESRWENLYFLYSTQLFHSLFLYVIPSHNGFKTQYDHSLKTLLLCLYIYYGKVRGRKMRGNNFFMSFKVCKSILMRLKCSWIKAGKKVTRDFSKTKWQRRKWREDEAQIAQINGNDEKLHTDNQMLLIWSNACKIKTLTK